MLARLAVPVALLLLLPASRVAAQEPPVLRRAWVERSHGLRHGTSMLRLAVSPDGLLLLIGDNAGYVYRSSDGGETWDESRVIADDVAPLPIPLPALEDVVLPNLGLVDAMPPATGAPGPESLPDPLLPTVGTGPAGGRASGGVGPRNRAEDPGDLLGRYFTGVADQPARINMLAICPTRPDRAYAATNYGLFRSEDAGATWLRVFAGVGNENFVATVACHPQDDTVAFMGTSEGFFYSRDGGTSWTRPLGPWGGLGTCDIQFDPADPGRLYVGTVGGVATTTDLDDFRFVYDPPGGTTEARTTCAVGPTPGDTFYVGSDDGAAVSRDHQASWQPIAPDQLERFAIRQVRVDPTNPDRAVLLTDARLYETRDGGHTITTLIEGHTWASLRWFAFDPRDPERIILLTGGHLLVREADAAVPRPDPSDPVVLAARRALAHEPDASALLEEALRRAHLDTASIMAQREQARTRFAWPRVRLAVWGRTGAVARDVGGLGTVSSIDGLYGTASCRLGVQPPNCWLLGARRDLAGRDESDRPAWGVGVALTWNLPFLEYSQLESHGVWGDILGVRDQVIYTVLDYALERARLLREIAAVAHDDESGVALAMRVAEVTSVLEAITGRRLDAP